MKLHNKLQNVTAVNIEKNITFSRQQKVDNIYSALSWSDDVGGVLA